MHWAGSANNPHYPNEMFRVELEPAKVLLVWYDPDPHAGHEYDEHHSLAEFLTLGSAQDSIRRILGETALGEIVAEVKRLLG